MKGFVKILTALIIGTTAAVTGYCAAQEPDGLDDAALKRVRQRVFRGKYYPVIDGDTVMMLVFNDIDVYPPLKFKNKKEEEFYWRTYEYLQTFETEKERSKYLKEMEGEVFNQYKPALKQFTKGQAKILVKLIGRETNQSGYDILKAFLGTTRALFYHGFGKLFGVNINNGYRPDKNQEDATIERIATLIEQGQL